MNWMDGWRSVIDSFAAYMQYAHMIMTPQGLPDGKKETYMYTTMTQQKTSHLHVASLRHGDRLRLRHLDGEPMDELQGFFPLHLPARLFRVLLRLPLHVGVADRRIERRARRAARRAIRRR